MAAESAERAGRRRPRRRQVPHVLRFLIVLSKTDPLIWRRIEVPEGYTFWDLHVAIQDAMGWLDYHLHEFQVSDRRSGQLTTIGIPDLEFPDERPCLPGWEVCVSNYFSDDSPPARYCYDFGDDWEHAIVCERIWPADPSLTYPRCLSGARACPPEDCGGISGFGDFLAAIADPAHPEHDSLLQWAGGAYDPEAFDPVRVRFDDPRRRLKRAFSD